MHSCTAVEGLGVLVAAGLTDVNYVHSVELFDPETGTWTLQSNLPFPNFGKGYIFYKWNVRKIGKLREKKVEFFFSVISGVGIILEISL